MSANPAPETDDRPERPGMDDLWGRQRQCTMKQLETALGKARNTVDGWVARKTNPCPYLRKADRERGVTWLFDLAEVVAWLEERAAESAASKFASMTSEGGDTSKDEAERLLAWTRYWREDLRLQADRNEVVRVDDVTTAWAGEYADLSQALEAIPNKAAVDLSGMTSPEEIQEYLADEIRKALRSLKGGVAGARRRDADAAEEPRDDEPAPAGPETESAPAPAGPPPRPKAAPRAKGKRRGA